MHMTQNPLAHLRDIHLPPPISLWPLAPGWYVLIIVGLILIAAIIYFSAKAWRQQQRRRSILMEINNYCDHYAENPSLALEKISALIRRIALARFDRGEVASLTGDNWLQFLDRTGKTQQFTQGIGQHLANAPYQRQIDLNIKALQVLLQQWIKRVI